MILQTRTPSSRIYKKVSGISPNTTGYMTQSELDYEYNTQHRAHKNPTPIKQIVRLDLSKCKRSPLTSRSRVVLQDEEGSRQPCYRDHVCPNTISANVRLTNFQMNSKYEFQISQFGCNAFKYIPHMTDPRRRLENHSKYTKNRRPQTEREYKKHTSVRKQLRASDIRIQYNVYDAQTFGNDEFLILEPRLRSSVVYSFDTNCKTTERA